MKETIMKEEKTTMMKQLVEQLNNASQAYYNGEAELMSDYEWDSKFDQLKLLEDETGIVLPDSPTNKVSEDSISGKKEPHEFPALSLAKVLLTLKNGPVTNRFGFHGNLMDLR